METCPICHVPLEFHTDTACIAHLVEAALPFTHMHRSVPNAARDDVEVLVRVTWNDWERLNRLVTGYEGDKGKGR